MHRTPCHVHRNVQDLIHEMHRSTRNHTGNTMSRNVWTESENLALLAYAAVLLKVARTGGKVNKRECICRLQAGPISNRTRGSIEAKMMNLSHAMVQAGDQPIPGYKPAGNFQRCLTAMHVSGQRDEAVYSELHTLIKL